MGVIYNSRCDIYRDVLEDDQFGGTIVVTGSAIAVNEPVRFDFYIPNQRTNIAQGIETIKTFSLYIRSTRQHPINMRENDYIIITFPPYHPEFGKRFRVRGLQRESLSVGSANSIIECTLTRIEQSRNNSEF